MNKKLIKTTIRQFASFSALSILAVQPPLGLAASSDASMTGAVQFSVVFDDSVDAHDAWNSAAVMAHLKDDLVLDGRTVAYAGSIVKGHVEPVDRSGTVISPSAAKGKRFSSDVPFKIVFDEITGTGNRALKMHAIPSNQCSMVSSGRRMHSIEVTTGGIVGTAADRDRESPIQLLRGDELVVKISQERSTLKAKDSAPASDATSTAAASTFVASTATSSTVEAPTSAASTPAASTPAAPTPVTSTPASALSQQEPAPDVVFTANIKPTATEAPKVIDAGAGAGAGAVSDSSDSDAQKNIKTKTTSDASSNSGEQTAAIKSKAQEAAAQTDDSAKETAADETASKPSDIPAASLDATIFGATTNQFRIEFASPLLSKSAREGDPVKALLIEDLKIDKKVIAKKSSLIEGHVIAVHHGCTWGSAIKSNKGQRNGSLKIQFERIITTDGMKIVVEGTVPAQNTIFNNGGVFRCSTAQDGGEIVKVAPVKTATQSDMNVVLRLASTAMMGPAAAAAMPLIVLAALQKMEPGMANSLRKKTIDKGDDVYIVPGDQIFVQAKIIDPAKEQTFVSGRIMHSKMKTIKTAESHPSVE